MPKTEAPVVGTEIDTGDMPGTLKNLILGVIGVAVALGIFASGQSLYNAVANNTPDAMQSVEVL